ncbi:MAG: aspartate kinase [Cyclobacteriaceae bacterium]|nr:aspartate kinase [Cyclobacteriaceae bacterium]
MKVFKFGGASVRHAAAIRQVARIIKRYEKENLIVVVSAMGKTTNALEGVVNAILAGKSIESELQPIREFHQAVAAELLPKRNDVAERIVEVMDSIQPGHENVLPDQLYDRIVSLGEILSSIIVSQYLVQQGLAVEWIDAREFITTDGTFREGKVNWPLTEKKMQGLRPMLSTKIILTQGFIGKSTDGDVTTLGREGSDYSAAIFASCLGAESVTIWKDVPGVMNADPKRLASAVVFDELPFREAAEMTYYGASVIHPKTIKPLANRNIPLLVKNFDNPELPGTIIHEARVDHLPPLIVFKDNQCLVSCRVTDYTFIDEQQLSFIFQELSSLNIKINVMQNSAISFSFCIDFREDKVLALIDRLAKRFEVYYNTGLTLITIKNYDAAAFAEYRNRPGILIEQSSRSTLQILVKM